MPRWALITWLGHMVGKHGLEDRNDNGERFEGSLSFHGFVNGGILIEYRACNKFDWASNNLQCTSNQFVTSRSAVGLRVVFWICETREALISASSNIII